MRIKISKTDEDNTQAVALSYKFYITIKLSRIKYMLNNLSFGIKLQYI
jgi:hypothetical protein